jgi:hypothetical protein
MLAQSHALTAESHLLICRQGASLSTLGDLAVIIIQSNCQEQSRVGSGPSPLSGTKQLFNNGLATAKLIYKLNQSIPVIRRELTFFLNHHPRHQEGVDQCADTIRGNRLLLRNILPNAHHTNDKTVSVAACERE